MDTPNPATKTFAVRYSADEPQKDRLNSANSFGLQGRGQLVVDENFLAFRAESGEWASGPPRIPRRFVANVDYNPENSGFVIRTSNSQDFVVLWVESRAEAEALWALLPQQKTPEFLAEQEKYARFDRIMRELGDSTPVTVGLIVLNVVMFGVVLLAGGDLMRFDGRLLVALGSNFGPLTWSGEPWRLITSAFLHGGLLHIALNMYALFQGGGLVERLFGRTRFALIYLLAALAGSVASSWWDPTRNSVGASGAIFGVYGAMFAFFALRRTDFPTQLWKSIGGSALAFCAYSLFIGAVSPFIDNAAHVGGLLGGLVAGALLTRPLSLESRAQPRPARLVLAALAVLLAWSLIKAPRVPPAGTAEAASWSQSV